MKGERQVCAFFSERVPTSGVRGFAAFVVVLLCATLCPAAEKTFHVTVIDVAGAPMADIAVGVRSMGQARAGLTGTDGLAHVSIDPGAQAQLAVVYVGPVSLMGVSDSERSRLRHRSRWVEAAKPKEALVRLTPTESEYSVVMQYRVGRALRARVTENGGPPTRTWGMGTPNSGLASPPTDPDGSFELEWEPVEGGVIIDADPFEDSFPGRSFIRRVEPTSIAPDGDMGTIDLDPAFGATGNVRFILASGPAAYDTVAALDKRSDWGLTLVKSDGRTVMSFFADSDLHIANDPAVMPVGTWYVVPGSYFCWTWTQRRIIEACLDGVDLSTSGIPSITVAEGANMEVNVDPVAAELAIQNYFTPPP